MLNDDSTSTMFVSLKGAKSSTDEVEMEGVSLIVGGTDTFDVPVFTNLGELECLKFRMAGTDDWRFEKVKMMKNVTGIDLNLLLTFGSSDLDGPLL